MPLRNMVRRRNRRAVTLKSQAYAQPLFLEGIQWNVVAADVASCTFSTECVFDFTDLAALAANIYVYGWQPDGLGAFTLVSAACSGAVATSPTTAEFTFAGVETWVIGQGYVMVWDWNQQHVRGDRGQTWMGATGQTSTPSGRGVCSFSNLAGFP